MLTMGSKGLKMGVHRITRCLSSINTGQKQFSIMVGGNGTTCSTVNVNLSAWQFMRLLLKGGASHHKFGKTNLCA